MVIFSKQPVHSTQEHFFTMYLQKTPEYPKFDPDSIEFHAGFYKTLQIAINNSSITQGHKKQHISNQISFFGEDTEDRAGHTGHIDEDHPIPMKSEAQRVQKRNFTSVPGGLEHTHKTLHLTGVTFGTAKGKARIGREGDVILLYSRRRSF